MLDGEGPVFVKNAAEVRRILQASNRVLAVFQGHDHDGDYRLLDGIPYYTLKAVVEGHGPDNNSYAIVEVQPDRSLTVTGYRKASSMRLSHATTTQVEAIAKLRLTLPPGALAFDPAHAIAAIALRTRSGVMGNWSRRAPVASWIALATTAPMMIMAGSPPPWAGSSFRSSRTVSIFGKDEKRGSS